MFSFFLRIFRFSRLLVYLLTDWLTVRTIFHVSFPSTKINLKIIFVCNARRYHRFRMKMHTLRIHHPFCAYFSPIIHSYDGNITELDNQLFFVFFFIIFGVFLLFYFCNVCIPTTADTHTIKLFCLLSLWRFPSFAQRINCTSLNLIGTASMNHFDVAHKIKLKKKKKINLTMIAFDFSPSSYDIQIKIFLFILLFLFVRTTKQLLPIILYDAFIRLRKHKTELNGVLIYFW